MNYEPTQITPPNTNMYPESKIYRIDPTLASTEPPSLQGWECGAPDPPYGAKLLAEPVLGGLNDALLLELWLLSSSPKDRIACATH